MRKIAACGPVACILAGIIVSSAAGQHSHPHKADAVGAVHFNVSCSEEVTGEFDRAVALLHHMQYVESMAAFESIAASDPNCGMAHWGIAMTLFQPLWPSRPSAEVLKRGWKEIRIAREAAALSVREKNLVAAAEAFFREPEAADWWTRIDRWSGMMAQAYAADTSDIETGAFYALSQLAAGQVSADQMVFNARAAEVLLSIYKREPTHPGAIHYMIHANDVDARANQSIDIVRSYSGIAPDVPHALHMPTHIFVRIGSWPEVIEGNLLSAEAARKQPAGDAVSHHYLHAQDYVVYGYLQRARDKEAQQVVEDLLASPGPFQPTFISAFHLASIPARSAIERRAWNEAASITPQSPGSVKWEDFPWAESISWFARGLGAVGMDDLAEAERAASRMEELRDKAQAAGETAFATYIEVDRLVLAAWMAQLLETPEVAIRLASEAVSLESTTQKHPVTPGALYPSQEALADLLMAQDRPEEALAAYEASLAVWPGRFNSLAGAARAARAAGLQERARTHYRQLVANTVGSSSNRPVLVEALEFLDSNKGG